MSLKGRADLGICAAGYAVPEVALNGKRKIKNRKCMDLQQKYSKICEVICNGYDIVKSLQILRILCISAGKVPCIFCAGNELYAVIHAMWIKRGGREKMVYNILDYGAVGDGKTKCTQAIQAAVDDCAKTGGQVYVPAGDFLSGTVCLRSEV